MIPVSQQAQKLCGCVSRLRISLQRTTQICLVIMEFKGPFTLADIRCDRKVWTSNRCHSPVRLSVILQHIRWRLLHNPTVTSCIDLTTAPPRHLYRMTMSIRKYRTSVSMLNDWPRASVVGYGNCMQREEGRKALGPSGKFRGAVDSTAF